MDIPQYLVDQIKEGKAVLFLGSGASYEAKNKSGENPPIGQELGKLLSVKFLGGEYKDAPLSQIGDYAINESDLFTVQDYIRYIFEDYEPSVSHNMLTTFKWYGIITTNYDKIIETAYLNKKKKSAQAIVPFIENGDRVEDKMRDINSVPLLKLHGCISRINNKDCPLILSIDQYVEYRKGRSRIFDRFKEWAFEKNNNIYRFKFAGS